MSSTRSIADIEADIADVKRANPNWLGNDAHVALMTAYTNEKNLKNGCTYPRSSSAFICPKYSSLYSIESRNNNIIIKCSCSSFKFLVNFDPVNNLFDLMTLRTRQEISRLNFVPQQVTLFPNFIPKN